MTNSAEKKKYSRGYTCGVYDMFHVGHLNILKNAKKYCDTLIVGVTTDELSVERKHKKPIIPFCDRCEIVKAIRYVDDVVPQVDMNKLKMVQKLNCDVVFVGSDWKDTPTWNEYEEQLKKINVDVIYLPHTSGISSTILRSVLANNKIFD